MTVQFLHVSTQNFWDPTAA